MRQRERPPIGRVRYVVALVTGRSGRRVMEASER
jgi:hypothetical protein